MQREQFEKRIRNLLPEATDEAMDAWTAYADELSQEDVEPEAELYDKSYVELTLIKQHCGEKVATQLFNYGDQFTSITLNCAALHQDWSAAGRWRTLRRTRSKTAAMPHRKSMKNS